MESMRPSVEGPDLVTSGDEPTLGRTARNFSWLLLEKGTRLAVGVLVGFIVARYLGPERLGQYGYCVAIIGLIQFLPELGLDALIRREIIARPSGTSNIVAVGILMRFIAGFFSYLIVVVLVLTVVSDPTERNMLLILGTIFFQPAPMVAASWFHARLESHFVIGALVFSLLVTAGIRLLFVYHGAPVEAFAFTLALEFVLGGLLVVLFARWRGLTWNLKLWDTGLAKDLLRKSWPIALSAFAVVIYMKIDTVMLKTLSGANVAGTYVAAVRISEIWYSVAAALATSALPALLRKRKSGKVEYNSVLQGFFDLNTGMAYLFALPVAFLAPLIVRVAYGDGFLISGPILSLHVWTGVFVFLNAARAQWLVSEGLTRLLFPIAVIGALSNIVLNLTMIPLYGGMGAAWATLISFSLSGCFASFFWEETRLIGWMQVRALFVPFLGLRYVVKIWQKCLGKQSKGNDHD
jgi:PST family polysaccharide transporter